MTDSILKGLSAAVIIFLFLPLSQCSYVTEEEITEEMVARNEQPERKVEVYDIVIFGDIKDKIKSDVFGAVLLLLTFFIPLAISLVNPKSWGRKLLKSFAQILAGSWLAFFAFIMVFLAETALIAGYVLNVMAFTFVVIAIYQFVSILLKKRNKYSQQDAAKDAAPLL